MKSVNDELKQIPARVEATKAKPEITADDKSILAVDFEGSQSSKYLKQDEISKLRNGSSVNDVLAMNCRSRIRVEFRPREI